MKVLTHYYKNGYDFTLVKREGNLAIAKGKSRTGSHENWEVIEIQSHTGLQMGANWVEASQYAPSNESWGTLGWTAMNAEHAEEIFQNKLLLKANNVSAE